MSDEPHDPPAEGEPIRRPVVRRSMMFTTRTGPGVADGAGTGADVGREVQSRGVAELNIGAGEALLDDGLGGEGAGGVGGVGGVDSAPEVSEPDADEPDLSSEYEYEYLQSLANEASGETPGTTTGPGRKKGTATGSGGDAQDSGDSDADQGDGS